MIGDTRTSYEILEYWGDNFNSEVSMIVKDKTVFAATKGKVALQPFLGNLEKEAGNNKNLTRIIGAIYFAVLGFFLL